MNTNKAYKQGVSLEAILRDGWSRNFQISQVMKEAKSMGYDVTKQEIVNKFIQYNAEYEYFLETGDFYNEL